MPSRILQSFQRRGQMLLLGSRSQGYGDAAAPGTWHSTTELHSPLSHPFPSTMHSKRAESSFNTLLQKQRGGKKSIHNLHIEGWFHKCSFVRPQVKGESKNVHVCYFNLTSGICNTLCLTPFWLNKTGFPQCMRQYRS